jgi:hypothetical protein
MGFTQFAITAVWILSMGKYDLTSFFERFVFIYFVISNGFLINSRGVASSPQRRYNLRRRTRDTDSEDWDQDLQQQQYSSRQRLIPGEDDEYDEYERRPQPTGLFSPIIRLWNFVKMCIDVFFLGIYTVFGWTFGRFVEEEGQLIPKKYSRRSNASRNGSVRSGTANGSIEETYGIFYL